MENTIAKITETNGKLHFSNNDKSLVREVNILAQDPQGDVSVVATSTLLRLADQLSKANIKDIALAFTGKLRHAARNENFKREDFINMLREELDFHNDVEGINNYNEANKPKTEAIAVPPREVISL